MTVIHGLLFGIFVLIMIYLGVKNADGVVKIFNAGGSQGGGIIKDLQGR